MDPRLTPPGPKSRPASLLTAAPLLRRPEPGSPWETEALHGEAAAVFAERDGYAHVQLQRDSYVGFLALKALGPLRTPNRKVAALRTHAYPGPSIKRPPVAALSLGALVEIVGTEGDFAVDPQGRHYWAAHLAPLDVYEPDFVTTAERFEHAPYLWGGRTSGGIDCSGLVQAALMAAGVQAPRDSDMQEALGAPAAPPLQRGDLIFWKGHVGVMTGSETLLHANGHHMAVAREPLETARARIFASGGGNLTAIRRL